MGRNRKAHKRPCRQAEKEPILRRVSPGLAYAMTMAQQDYAARRSIRRQMIVNEEVQKVSMDHLQETEEWFYACICLALHREYGWSTKRIMRTIVAAQNIHNENVEAGRSDADLWDMVANETGITLDKYYPGGEEE